MTALVALFFGLIQVDRAVADSTADTLFFRRFGVNYLPYMFIVLGLITALAILGYAAVVPRLDKRRLFQGFLVTLASLLLVERVAITFDLPALYPIFWLTVNVAVGLLGTLLWTTAGEVCDARQAKRLFPIFVSANILGGLLGSFATGPAARLVGTENLIIVCALMLAAAAFVFRSLARRYFPLAERPRGRPAVTNDIRAGYDFMKNAPLFQLLAVAAVLFSVLYFSMAFPFSQAASAAFANEADLAGFLGLFKGVSSLLAFLAALLIANRLYARIGIVNALLLLPLTYLLGFVVFAASFSLSTATLVRLAQMVVMSGIGDGASSAFYNVVPSELRAQVRAVNSGVPGQLGIGLSGILLLLAGGLLNTTAIFIMGIVVGALCAIVVWRMRRGYVDALIAALRAGRLDVFQESHRHFAGLAQDLDATRTVVSALSDPKPATQRLAAEMLGQAGATSAVPALIERLAGSSAEVRVSIVGALGRLADQRAAQPVAERVEDESPAVRAAALEALPTLCAPSDAGILDLVRLRLEDPDLSVQLQAALSLARMGDVPSALHAWEGFLHEACDEQTRVSVFRAFGPVLAAAGSAGESLVVVEGLRDPSPAVRRAACQGLAGSNTPAVLPALADGLSDAAPPVRLAAAQSLRLSGPEAVPYILASLKAASDPEVVLDAFPVASRAISAPLRDYAQETMARLRAWQAAGHGLPGQGRAVKLLRQVLEARTMRAEQQILKIIGLLGDQRVMQLVARTLRNADAAERATAVEALDTLGDKQLVKALLPLLETAPADGHLRGDQDGRLDGLVESLIAEEDPLVRAAAIRAAGEMALTGLVPQIMRWAGHPSALVSEAACETLHQLGGAVETLTTLSLVERTLLLREVPLFSDLRPDDLVQVAEAAQERLFADGAILCREGEPGDELFVIAAGQVRVTRQAEGSERLLATRQAGDFVGEMAIIDSTPRFATVSALGETRTLVISAEAFRAILRDRPEVALAVMRSLSRRLREPH